MTERRRPDPPFAARGRFFRPVAVGGIVVREARIDGTARLSPHAHDEAFASLVLSGHCVEAYRGDARILSPGVATFNAPGQTHRITVGDAGLRALEIVFRPSFWSAAGLRPPAAGAGDVDLAGASWLLRRLLAEYRRLDDDSTLTIESLAVELASALSGRPRPRDDGAAWMPAVIEQLTRGEPPAPSLSGLARVHGIHPAHLARTFRARFGCTVGEYAQRQRVARACRALRDRDTPLSRLAFEFGFSDQSHFCRVFKRITGTTPGRFRRFARSV